MDIAVAEGVKTYVRNTRTVCGMWFAGYENISTYEIYVLCVGYGVEGVEGVRIYVRAGILL